MTTDPWGRYSSTQQFLAELDDERAGPIADEDNLGALDLDEPLAGEPGADDHGDNEGGYAEFGHEPTDYEPTDYEPTGYGPTGYSDAGDTDVPEDPRTTSFGVKPFDENTDEPDYGADEFGDDAPASPDHHDLDPLPDDTTDFGDIDSAATAPRFSKPVVIGFVGVVAVVTLGLAAAMISMQSSPTEAAPQAGASTHAPVAPPPPAPAVPMTNPADDVPIPFQASSPCPQAGSGAAQNVASEDPTRAWVCMRDSDGQVLTLDMGKPMKVTAISLTPGWIGTDASGTDQWMKHRVVTRVQWILINGADRTVVTQDTKNAHGPVVQPMPSNGPDQGVLASKIQMIILQTSRPPADTPTTPAPGAGPANGGGFLDSVLGAPLAGAPAPGVDPNLGTGEGNSDPVDNTVAISSIQIIGHPPL